MASSKLQDPNKLSKFDVIAYGFGGVATTMMATVKMQFAMKFMTDVAGISAAVIGTIMMFISVFDAVNDPIIGGMADRCNTRWGKYRPFMMAGSLILALSIVMQFSVPPVGGTWLLVYFTVAMVVYSIGMTATAIPWQALNSVMSSDVDQRNLLLASRQFMGFFAAALVGVVTLGMVDAFGGGKSGWLVSALIFGAVCVLTMFIAFLGARKKDHAGAIPTPPKTSLKDMAKGLVSNKALVMAGLMFGVYTLATWIISAAQLYYFEDVVGDINLVASTSGAMLLTNFLVVPLMPLLLRKLGKKGAIALGMGVMAVRFAVLGVLGGNASVGLVFGFVVLYNVGSVIANFAILSLIPDCTDYAEYTTGTANAGLVNSTITFMQKFGGSFSTLIVGVIIETAGYRADAAATPAVQNAILLTVTWLPLAILAISLVLLKFYPITTKFGVQMRAELAQRRAAKAGEKG